MYQSEIIPKSMDVKLVRYFPERDINGETLTTVGEFEYRFGNMENRVGYTAGENGEGCPVSDDARLGIAIVGFIGGLFFPPIGMTLSLAGIGIGVSCSA